LCGGVDILKIDNSPLIDSVSYLNLGGLELSLGGLSPPKPPPRGDGIEQTVDKCWISCRSGAQPAGGGHLGHLPPPKFSKHCIAILTYAETFKEGK